MSTARRMTLEIACQRIVVRPSSQSHNPDAVTITVSASSRPAWDRLHRNAPGSERRCHRRRSVVRIQARRCHRCGPANPAKTSPMTLCQAIDTGSSSTETTAAAIRTRSTAQRQRGRRLRPVPGEFTLPR